MYNKILGGFYGAAIGDSLLKIDNEVTVGRITENFSIAYYISKNIAENSGTISRKAVCDALIEWENKDGYVKNTKDAYTRKALERIKADRNGENQTDINQYIDTANLDNYIALSTCGAAARIFVAGLMNPKNIDGAIDDAFLITKETHNDTLAVSGACAVAAAVSEAMGENATVYSIVQAGLYGAKKGEEMAQDSCIVFPGPSVVKRIEMAVRIVLKENTFEEIAKNLADLVGNGMHVAEAVPSAFGLLIASRGETEKAVRGAMMMGNYDNSIATIVGAISGTYAGYASIDKSLVSKFNEINDIDIDSLAKKF